MFGVGLPEFTVIALVAVVVFGPDKLPEFARQAGRFLHRLKVFATGARDELRTELGPEFRDLELRDLDPRIDRPQARDGGDGGGRGGSGGREAPRTTAARGGRGPAVRPRGDLARRAGHIG